MQHTQPRHTDRPHAPRENYTLGGLLAYAAFAPMALTLLLAPGVVLAFVVGALTAVVAFRVHARVVDNRGVQPPSARPAAGDRGALSE